MNDRKDPILYIVIPCYNEQEVMNTMSVSVRAATVGTRTLCWRA